MRTCVCPCEGQKESEKARTISTPLITSRGIHLVIICEAVTFPGRSWSKLATLRIVLVYKIHEICLECVKVLRNSYIITITCYLTEIVPQLQTTD